jgi:hypothetical protein
MSARGAAESNVLRPSTVLMSATTPLMLVPVACLISATDASILSLVNPFITTETPSLASASAHALPKPRDEAQTIAVRSLIPKSMFRFPLLALCRLHET